MGREFELKFSAEPAQQEMIRKDFSADWQSIAMETVYYDTPDRALGAKRWTLRRRYENGCAVCTLKTPAPGGARGEWEVVCQDIGEAIPELCKLGAPRELLLLTASGITKVCGARFTRQAAAIERSGCILELALDRGILLGGGKEEPLCEVEVELKSGTDADAVAFARFLAETYRLTPQPKSKFSRALALSCQK